MGISIDITTLEKVNEFVTENVDSKGIDSLKKEIEKNPKLKNFFKMDSSEKDGGKMEIKKAKRIFSVQLFQNLLLRRKAIRFWYFIWSLLLRLLMTVM